MVNYTNKLKLKLYHKIDITTISPFRDDIIHEIITYIDIVITQTSVMLVHDLSGND